MRLFGTDAGGQGPMDGPAYHMVRHFTPMLSRTLNFVISLSILGQMIMVVIVMFEATLRLFIDDIII